MVMALGLKLGNVWITQGKVPTVVRNGVCSSSVFFFSESYNNSHNRVKITPQGGVTIFGVNITPKRSYFFL